MKIPLVATVAELKYRLSMPISELDVLRIINMAPPQNWEISITVLEGGKVVITAIGANIEDSSKLVDGIIPSVFNCDSIEVVKDGRRWKCCSPLGEIGNDSNVLHFEDVGSVTAGVAELKLCGYAKNLIPASFSKEQSIRDQLMRTTWLGSGGIQKERFSVTLKVLGITYNIKNASVMDEILGQCTQGGIPVLKIEKMLGNPPVGRVFLKTHFRMKGLSFRWTYGIIKSQEKLEWLGAGEISDLHAEIDIDLPTARFAPDGTFRADGDLSNLPVAMRDFFTQVRASKKARDYHHACEEQEKKQSAQLIDQRKADLLNTNFVFYSDKLVYKVPTSEIELVSLHQKLEGIGGVPLAQFVSLEYTPKLGIDALVNFKIRGTEALTKFATVEFEYHYENFFAHRHPVEQTNLIICWDRRINAKVPQPVPDLEFPWLSHLNIQGGLIRVIEVSKYPSLIFKKLSEANI